MKIWPEIPVIAFACGLGCATMAAKLPSITASGEMPLKVQLIDNGLEGCPTGLTLVHRLVNTGSKYVSRVGIPELESRVVPVAADKYLWITTSGRIYRLELGKPFYDGSRMWLMERTGNTISIHSDRDHFFYEMGYLTEIRSGQRSITYERTANAVQSISAGKETLQVIYGTSSYRIVLSESVIDVALNEWGSVESCRIDGRHGPKLHQFQYKNALISELRINGADEVKIGIGNCDWRGDYARNSVFHPVVRSVGTLDVRIKRNLNQIDGTISKDGHTLVVWRVVRRGERFFVSEVTGAADLILADVDTYVFDG
jgi:hypothetical protein